MFTPGNGGEGRWDELVIPLTHSFEILFSTGRGIEKMNDANVNIRHIRFDIFDSIYSTRQSWKVKEGRKWSSEPSIKRGGKGREMSAWNLLPSHLSSLSINYLIPWLVITHHPSKKEKNLISSLYFSLAQTQTKPSLAHISSLPLSPLDDINLPWGTQFVSDLIVWSYDRMMGESLLLILVLTVSEREASGIIGVQCLLS